MENLYTVVVDYKGGTYVSQFHAYNIEELKRKWILFELNTISKLAKIPYYGKKIICKKIFEKEIELNDLHNVWNNDIGFISKSYFSMIIILTVPR